MRGLVIAFLLAVAAGPAQAGDWGAIYSAVTYASEYRFQGFSSSDRQPAVQGYVHWYRPDGYYLGAFGSTVDYGYAQSPNVEIDLYGGRNWRLDKGRTELKAEVMGHLFPDDETPGPTLNFVTTKLAVRRFAGPLNYAATAAFVPDGAFRSGRIWRVEADAVYALTPKLRVKALAGHNWTERGQDRTYWEAGVAATWKRFIFEGRYVDTDLSRAECGFNRDVCGAALVGSVIVNLPPIL